MVDNTKDILRCNKKYSKTLYLTIIGKGTEVEKMQKRLRCAARSTGIDLQLSWQHEYPDRLNIGAIHDIAVTHNHKLLLDGLETTENIEALLEKL